MGAMSLMQRLLKKKIGLNEKGPLGNVVKRNKKVADQLDQLEDDKKKKK
jgi:hypothetical protein